MTRPAATLAGFAAIAMWSLLALFTASSGAVPPFQLSALCFSIGAAIGFIWLAASGRWRDLRQPLPVWALGVTGLFGYHALYFTALRNAPPIEAGLIAYLWPLLIVLFSALLPGERLRWHHLAGAVLGLAGTVLIVSGGNGFALESGYAGGYLAALGCALIWSTYSVTSRRFAEVPSGIVAGYCLAAAVLSVPAHLAFEITVWPQTAGQWLAVAGLGLMPVGAAFYVWDIGVKHGDIQFLGVASYGAPLLSTLVLIAAGFGVFSVKIGIAALLIAGGAVVASSSLLNSARFLRSKR
jgi:drug/metabolite transporter (DMT)-like permease